MRRLVALLVIALAGATLFGLSNTSSGISVNGTTVSNSTFRSELAAFASSTTLQCYLAALVPVNYAAGAGGASVAATGASAWANLRIEGVAINQFAASNLKFHPSAATLARARTSLEGELTQAATSRSYRCPGTSAAALNAMPREMRNFEVAAQAASLDLLSKLNGTVSLTLATAKTYYASHTANYDTICVSVALVNPSLVAAFDKDKSAGLTVAQLAAKYSSDPSKTKGGAYGCFAPSSGSYTGVRADTITSPLDTFPTTPQYITYNNAPAALFVAATKRTPTPFAKAQATVLSDLQSSNANNANTEKETILLNSAIAVDPAFGRWGLGTAGPTTFAPAAPAPAVVGSTTVRTSLTTPSKSTYK